MVNYFHDLPTGPDPPSELYVVVEMTRASKNKYEYDYKNNIFMEHRDKEVQESEHKQQHLSL